MPAWNDRNRANQRAIGMQTHSPPIGTHRHPTKDQIRFDLVS